MEEDSNTNEADVHLKIGIICNLKQESKGGPIDSQAEYDNIETVKGIKNALEKARYNVVFLEANTELPTKLTESKIDIAFNIAEGRKGRGREAEVAALLNMYDIPFTGSDETTLCIALDKALTKRLLTTYNILTPRYYEVKTIEDLNNIKDIEFPIIVKPNAEGSSKGISDISIANSFEELKDLVNKNLSTYSQNILIEEYIEGREFTVGIIGNGEETKVFSPMEIIYKEPTQGEYHVYSYNVKQNFKKFVEYKCPAQIDKTTEKDIIRISLDIYKALECKDFARIDFRLSKEGKIYFIEANPLPGLAPEYSDYPILASFNGIQYDDVVVSILKAALKRYGLREKRD